MTKVINLGDIQIGFSPKRPELTQKEYETLVGLTLFLGEYRTDSGTLPTPNAIHPRQLLP